MFNLHQLLLDILVPKSSWLLDTKVQLDYASNEKLDIKYN